MLKKIICFISRYLSNNPKFREFSCTFPPYSTVLCAHIFFVKVSATELPLVERGCEN